VKFSFEKAGKAQKALSKLIEIKPLSGKLNLIAGCDLTFLNPFQNPTTGIGAFVVLTYPELEVVERVYDVMEIKIPYVPGFLAFRELPLLIKAFRKLKRKPDLVVVDGHGIAHPRRLGIAAHFGVIAQIPTIGCAKKPLYGNFKLPCEKKGCCSPITDPKKGEIIGYAVRTKKGVKPVYVSPGNLITLDECVEITLNSTRGYRLPEPTRLAHNYLQSLRKCIIHRKLK